MTLTANFASKIITSDASITDVVAFHMALRDIEDDPIAMIHPVVHTFKSVDLGAGAVFPAIKFINGWTLQFPAGSFEIRGGNVDATINPVAGCFLKYTASAAYAVTSIGAGGATPADIATAVLAAMQASPPPINVKLVNGTEIGGSGVPPTIIGGVVTDPGDPWGPVP